MSTHFSKSFLILFFTLLGVSSCSIPDGPSEFIYCDSYEDGESVMVMEQNKWYILDDETNRYRCWGMILENEITLFSGKRFGYWEIVETESGCREMEIKAVGEIANEEPLRLSEFIPARHPNGTYIDKVNHKLVINEQGWVFYHKDEYVSEGSIEGPYLYDKEGIFKGFAFYENGDYDDDVITVRIGAQLLFKIVE